MHHVPGLHYATTKNKGRGVFTSIDLKEGDTIEICPVILIPKAELPIIHRTFLHDYYFLWGSSMDQCVITLGYGSLYNHATYPNANFILDLEKKTVDIFAIKDIKKGSEITINYHGQPGNRDPLWFEELSD